MATVTQRALQAGKRPRFGSPKLPPTFWARVKRDPRTRCWLWTSPLNDDGYPHSATIDSYRQSPVRHAYRALIGPIPKGLTLDHLCRVRHCVNPSHTEPCTGGENARRAKLLVKACPAGHRYTKENIIWVGAEGEPKRRGCRICYNDRSRGYWHTTRKHAQKRERRAAGYRGGWDETPECRNGHPKTVKNTYVSPTGAKACNICRREAAARCNAKKAGRL